MNKSISLVVCLLIGTLKIISGQDKGTALLLIDIQNFYFPGGKSELVEPENAAMNAAKLLSEFRKKSLPVVFVCHRSSTQSEISNIVKPKEGEKIIFKDAVNSFKGTDLLEFLKLKKISSLVICGMQTHMCVEAAVRAASDFGFNCTLIYDACATKDLVFEGKTIKASDVHYSTLSTLKSYSRVISTDEFLDTK